MTLRRNRELREEECAFRYLANVEIIHMILTKSRDILQRLHQLLSSDSFLPKSQKNMSALDDSAALSQLATSEAFEAQRIC